MPGALRAPRKIVSKKTSRTSFARAVPTGRQACTSKNVKACCLIFSGLTLAGAVQATELPAGSAAGNSSTSKASGVAASDAWKDPSQPLDFRVHDLVRRMTLAEKVSQMDCVAPAIPRLGIPIYSYRNECLHGRRSPYTNDFNTAFPQAIGMAATWDTPLVHGEADVISTEARAVHNDYVAKHDGNCTNSYGLTDYTRTSISSVTRAGGAARKP